MIDITWMVCNFYHKLAARAQFQFTGNPFYWPDGAGYPISPLLGKQEIEETI